MTLADTEHIPSLNSCHLVIIGGGLIGSSIARAVARRKIVSQLSIIENHTDHVRTLKNLNLDARITQSIEDVIPDAQFIILATPIGKFETIVQSLKPVIRNKPIISDVGSTKQNILELFQRELADLAHIVPAHPIAGTENSGPEAGFENLFEGRWCLLTPPENTSSQAIRFVENFWQQVGSHTEIMDSRHHDLVLAITSHLPHLIAYNIVGTASDLESVTRSEVIKYSASGFRDFTRIAASDPEMWRDIFLNNKEAVLEALGRFIEDLFSLQRAIRWNDGDTLENLFTKTRKIRREIIETGQDIDSPDFGRLQR